MSKLVFIGEPKKKYDATIASIGSDQISVLFSSEVPSEEVLTTGFNVVNEHNGIPQGDYTAYKFIYRKDVEGNANEVQLSRDGSVYIPVPSGEGETELPVTPTLTLAEVIALKKKDLATSCRVSIENGVTVVINGVAEKFSYSLEGGDQTNIDDIFNTMMQTGMGQYYHADGGSCKLYLPKDIFAIYTSQKLNKLRHTTYYNQLCMILKDRYSNLEDTAANRANVMAIVYGDPEQVLDGEYLEIYNRIISDGTEVFNHMKAKFEEQFGNIDSIE